jgi:hypothetical protein
MTARLEILPFVATHATRSTFVVVEGQTQMLTMHDTVVKQLSDARLGQLVRNSSAGAIVFDAGRLDFGPQDVAWVVHAWPPMLATIGVRRLSVVVADALVSVVRAEIDRAARALAPLGFEIRAFSPAQRADATGWLGPAPLPAPQAPYRGGAPAFAQAMAAAPHETAQLRLPARAHYHAAGWGGVVGFLLGVAGTALAALAAGERPDISVVGGGIVASALVVAGVFAVHYLRGVPPVKLTWDARGIAEWAGNDVTTFLAWPGARYALLETSLTTKTRGGQVLGTQRGRILQLSDDSGKTITLCDGYRRPAWLDNRPAEVPLGPFLSMVQAPRSPMVVVPDKLGFSDRARKGFGAVAIASYVAFGTAGGYLTFNNHYNDDRAITIALLWLGCVLFAVRAIWPLTRVGDKRLRASALVETALRGVVFLFFLGVSLVLAAHTS